MFLEQLRVDTIPAPNETVQFCVKLNPANPELLAWEQQIKSIMASEEGSQKGRSSPYIEPWPNRPYRKHRKVST